MAKYCAKDGNDANGGTSWADAKLTVGALVAALAANEVGYVASGRYNEAVTFTNPATLEGVGEVLIDAEGLAANAVTIPNTAGTFALKHLRVRAPGRTCIYKSAGYNPFLNVYDCTLYDADIGIEQGGNYCAGMTVDSVLIRDVVTGISHAGIAWTLAATVRNCTILTTGTGIVFTSTTPKDLYQCFISAPVLLNLLTKTLSYSNDYNCLDFSGGNKTIINGVDKTSLVDHQATGYDTNSLSSTPAAELNSPTHGAYRRKLTSQLNIRGRSGQPIGAFAPALCFSPANNVTEWNAPTVESGSWEQDGSGYWQLASGSSGALRFGDGAGNAMDLGGNRMLREVVFSLLETPPASVLDYSTADSAPRQWTYRYKAAATTFALSNDTGWVEANRLAELLLSGTNQFFAVEATLRTDGV